MKYKLDTKAQGCYIVGGRGAYPYFADILLWDNSILNLAHVLLWVVVQTY